MKHNEILDNFIVFEGIDGAGKTTQINAIASLLHEQRFKVHTTREPYTGIIGTLIRDILNDTTQTLESEWDEYYSSSIFAHLFATDRYEHIYSNKGILSFLASKHIVLCDRYLFSSLAYQGDESTRALSETLNNSFPLPAALVYFDITPEKSINRMENKHKDRMEHIENLRNVHLRYDKLLTFYTKHYPEMQIFNVDASLPKNTLTQQIFSHIQRILTPSAT